MCIILVKDSALPKFIIALNKQMILLPSSIMCFSASLVIVAASPQAKSAHRPMKILMMSAVGFFF